MSTVAHTILEFGPGQDVRLPRPPRRRLLVQINASFQAMDDADTDFVTSAIEEALKVLNDANLSIESDFGGEEGATAIVEIHNMPEEPGT